MRPVKPIRKRHIRQKMAILAGSDGMHLMLGLGIILKASGEQYFKKYMYAKFFESSGTSIKFVLIMNILQTPGSCRRYFNNFGCFHVLIFMNFGIFLDRW